MVYSRPMFQWTHVPYNGMAYNRKIKDRTAFAILEDWAKQPDCLSFYPSPHGLVTCFTKNGSQWRLIQIDTDPPPVPAPKKQLPQSQKAKKWGKSLLKKKSKKPKKGVSTPS